MTAYAKWLVRHPLTGWLIFLLLTGCALWGASRLQFDDDLRTAFESEENHHFSLPENAYIILVEADSLFSNRNITALREFDFSLREVEEVSRVVSIFDARSLTAEDDYYPPLMPSDDASPPALEKAKTEAQRHPAIASVLINEKANTLLFFADPVPEANQVDELLPVQASIEEAVERLISDGDGISARVAGVPALRVEIIEMTRKEQIFFTFGCSLIGLLVALIMFRNFRAVVICLPVPLISSLWIMGAMGLVGEPVNAMNNMVNVIVMIVALTDTVHLVLSIRRNSRKDRPVSEAIIIAIGKVGGACFLTSFTTAIAFSSLIFSSNWVIAKFGLVCAAGTMLVFITVLLLVPLSALIVAHKNFGFDVTGRDPAQLKIFEQSANWALGRRKRVILTGFALCAISILICFTVESDYRYRENLDRDTILFQTVELIDKEFGGSQPLYLLASWKTSEPVGLEEVLAEIESVFSDSKFTGKPFSILNLIESTRTDSVAEFRAAFPDADLSTFINFETKEAIVSVPLRDAGSRKLEPYLKEISGKLEQIERKHEGFGIKFTGLTEASIRSSRIMIQELIGSLFAAAAAIFLIISIGFRSWRIGLISIIPNLLPMSLTGSFLALSGLPFQYISTLALTICLGVSVDDTIHFLSRYQQERKSGFAPLKAIHASVRAVGSALVTSTIVLVSGMALLQISGFPTLRLFSWLCIATLAVALLSDLILLPAMMAFFSRKEGEPKS